jgi:hypothetical protein
MARRTAIFLALITLTFISNSWSQAPNSKPKRLPEFDIRENAGASTTAPAQARALVERRRASLESFAASPAEVKLGTRIVANQYGLPKLYLRDGHSLSAPSTQRAEDIARGFLRNQSPVFSLDSSEVDNLRLLVDDATDTARFVSFNQTVGGIDVFNGLIKFTLSKAGEVVQVAAGDIVPGLQVNTTPVLSAEDAVKAAYAVAGSSLSGTLSRVQDVAGKRAYANPKGNGYSPITTELSIFPMTASSGRLAYRVFLEIDVQSWYEILVDAETGALLFRHNLYVFSSQGNVWTESPNTGTRTLVTFPDSWLPSAGTNTITTGNNVDAFLSTGFNDTPTASSDPNLRSGRAYSATQVFDFPFGDGTVVANPRLFQAAAVTNLFYFVNTAHDYYYGLGFNEASGNMQTDNFGKGGIGNDAVIAEAQFGVADGITDNSSFAPTPEGISPRIRIGVYTRNTPSLTDDLDGDYAGDIILHEYGHGVSNRLVGAKVSSSCLVGIQSGAMGEGWSDYFASSFFNNPVHGGYVSQNFTQGERRYSYEGYPLTYEDIGTGMYGYEVHDDGEIWAGTLWDLRKSLGQTITDRLVVDGLRGTPCNPSMADARDAILSADQATNNGVNRKTIWIVFARHGMGYSALGVDGTLFSGTRYDAAYDLPPDLQTARNPAITSNPLVIRTASGDLYKYIVTASNPAGGMLNFALTTGPAGMTVDPSQGAVTWSATFVTQRVKITVTDGMGGRVVHGYALPVLTTLTAGTPIPITGGTYTRGFALINVPTGTPVLQATLRDGTGDPDLGLFGPDGSFFSSQDFGDSTETISLSNPKPGLWLVEVYGNTTYSAVTLKGGAITPPLLSANSTMSALSGDLSSETFFRISIPAGASNLTISTNGGTGDVDVFLRKGSPAVCSLFSDDPCLEDAYSARDGNVENISTNNPAAGDWYIDMVGYDSYSGVTLTITTAFPPVIVSGGGAQRTSTTGTTPVLTAGYATATPNAGTTPYGTAVFSLTQNGYIVSEAGVPASPPTQDALIFIDYRGGVVTKSGTISISTGLAMANTGTTDAALTFTLRDSAGQVLVSGNGTLAAGTHRSKFIQELRDIAPNFFLPGNFPTSILYGSLEILSSQPVSIIALRLTTNERGDTLLTSTPIADLSRPPGNAPLYFPQLADGGGFTTSMILLNTSAAAEAGTIAVFDDGGNALSVRPANSTAGTSFPYSIPASGFFVFQTDGSPSATNVGSIRVTPSSGSSPIGAGIFSYSPSGTLVTESGIPSAMPTTLARLYVDKSNSHDTGLAVTNPSGSPIAITATAFQNDGVTPPAGTIPATLNLTANGHKSAFAGEIVQGLPTGFTGVLELRSTTPFAVLTLRALSNGRDTLLTTFPVADQTQPAPSPIVFPQIADGGGFSTQFIFVSASGATSVNLKFVGDDGSPLPLSRQ